MTPKTGPTTAQPADPCCFVIFGASGDLTHRLLVPALYNLGTAGLLPDAFSVIGIGRTELSSEAFRAGLAESLRQSAKRPIDDTVARRLFACVTYLKGDVDDPATYELLRRTVERIEAARGTRGNRLFYLA